MFAPLVTKKPASVRPHTRRAGPGGAKLAQPAPPVPRGGHAPPHALTAKDDDRTHPNAVLPLRQRARGTGAPAPPVVHEINDPRKSKGVLGEMAVPFSLYSGPDWNNFAGGEETRSARTSLARQTRYSVEPSAGFDFLAKHQKTGRLVIGEQKAVAGSSFDNATATTVSLETNLAHTIKVLKAQVAEGKVHPDAVGDMQETIGRLEGTLHAVNKGENLPEGVVFELTSAGGAGAKIGKNYIDNLAERYGKNPAFLEHLLSRTFVRDPKLARAKGRDPAGERGTDADPDIVPARDILTPAAQDTLDRLRAGKSEAEWQKAKAAEKAARKAADEKAAQEAKAAKAAQRKADSEAKAAQKQAEKAAKAAQRQADRDAQKAQKAAQKQAGQAGEEPTVTPEAGASASGQKADEVPPAKSATARKGRKVAPAARQAKATADPVPGKPSAEPVRGEGPPLGKTAAVAAPARPVEQPVVKSGSVARAGTRQGAGAEPVRGEGPLLGKSPTAAAPTRPSETLVVKSGPAPDAAARRGGLPGFDLANKALFYWGVADTVLTNGLTPETAVALGKSYAVSVGAEALLGDAAGPIGLFSNLAGDSVQATADQARREALEKVTEEIDDRVANYLDSHPGEKRQQVRDDVIRSMLAKQQEEEWRDVTEEVDDRVANYLDTHPETNRQQVRANMMRAVVDERRRKVTGMTEEQERKAEENAKALQLPPLVNLPR